MAVNPSISQIQIVSNMVQGVSQQAIQNRRDAQCEEQFDCTNSVLDGVIPRPHAEVLKVISGQSFEGAFFMETSHGGDEHYLIGFKADGTPFGFNLDTGVAVTITNIPGNVDYVAYGTPSPKDKLRGQTVDDFNFVVNREKVPAMAVTTTPAKVNQGLIFVRATAFSSAYTVTLTGTGITTTTVTYTTNATTVAPTATIAAAIVTGINGVNGFTAVRSGSSIQITRADGKAFSIETSDGNGDDYMYGYTDSIPKASRIPARGFNGMLFKVRGEDHTSDDDYYIQFVGDPSTGYWQEVAGPGIQNTIDPTTMPIALVCTALNTFEYRQLSWSTRIAGDDDTAKLPSFIGKKPRGLMYHQSRLGFMWAGGTVFSKTSNPFTFFADTVQTVLATAPIDTKMAGSVGKGPPVLDFGLEFQENLFAWAQQQQFRISSGTEAFKQDSVEVHNSMSYEYSPNAFPLGVGAFLFLTTDVGMNATLRTILFSGGKLAGDTDVAAHCPKYIPSGLTVLTGSDTLRQLYMVGDGDQTILTQFCWVYSANDGFQQTALNKWRMPGTTKVLWASIDSNLLRALLQVGSDAMLVTFNLSPQIVDPVDGAQYLTRLDFRVDETSVTDLAFASGSTTFKLPYTPISGVDLLVYTSEDKTGGYTRGRQFKVTDVTDNVVTVEGDLTGYGFYVGHRIKAERLDSEFCIRTDKGALPVDSITLNSYLLEMADTQYTRIEVDTNSGHWEEVFEGRVLGTPSGQTGAPIPQSWNIKTSIRDRSENTKLRLVNDTPFYSKWQNSSYDFDAVGWKGAK